ncbi:hypothetical protein DFH06DRAFT_560207 [Mycena polygramma]|nr:hypothetical protein DFH06DRAFT_560207 [Mycena polygramma]
MYRLHGAIVHWAYQRSPFRHRAIDACYTRLNVFPRRAPWRNSTSDGCPPFTHGIYSFSALVSTLGSFRPSLAPRAPHPLRRFAHPYVVACALKSARRPLWSSPLRGCSVCSMPGVGDAGIGRCARAASLLYCCRRPINDRPARRRPHAHPLSSGGDHPLPPRQRRLVPRSFRPAARVSPGLLASAACSLAHSRREPLMSRALRGAGLSPAWMEKRRPALPSTHSSPAPARRTSSTSTAARLTSSRSPRCPFFHVTAIRSASKRRSFSKLLITDLAPCLGSAAGFVHRAFASASPNYGEGSAGGDMALGGHAR